MKVKETYLSETHRMLVENGYGDYVLDYILTKKNEHGTIDFQGYATSREDPDEMISCLYTDGRKECQYVPEWDFNVDDYLFESLENGHEISYMSLECHYNIWCSVDENREELNHLDGLQKYLSYCQKNNITPETIANITGHFVNIMDLYKENNCGYDIIASTAIAHSAIVLGYNKRKDEYVTWITSPNRKNGYDMGVYRSNYKEAFKNYEARCHVMLEKHLIFEKNKTKPKEKDIER